MANKFLLALICCAVMIYRTCLLSLRYLLLTACLALNSNLNYYDLYSAINYTIVTAILLLLSPIDDNIKIDLASIKLSY